MITTAHARTVVLSRCCTRVSSQSLLHIRNGVHVTPSCVDNATRGALSCTAASQRLRCHAALSTEASAADCAAVGDQIPNVRLSYFDIDGEFKEELTHDLFRGKKAVIFGVPGAFLPTCSMKHLPGYMEYAPSLRNKGVDLIACVSVNDAFVMDAWARSLGSDGSILMLADGAAVFTQALGTQLDLSERGVGIRSRRYAMIVDDCQVLRDFLLPRIYGSCFCAFARSAVEPKNHASRRLVYKDPEKMPGSIQELASKD